VSNRTSSSLRIVEVLGTPKLVKSEEWVGDSLVTSQLTKNRYIWSL